MNIPHSPRTDNEQIPIVLSEKSDPHILDFFTLLARYKKTIVLIVAIVGFIFLAVTFIMPFTFSGLSTLVPPEKQSGGNQLLSFLSGSSALDLMKGAENPALDMFKNILDSRTLSLEIAGDPRVKKYFSSWDTSQMSIAFAVHDCLTSEALRNGMFNVQVDIKTHWFPTVAEKDSARALVPYLAKLFVEHLDRYNRERLMTSARNTRMFVEKEYSGRLVQLDTAYRQLQAFQETHKTISLTEQLSATVTSAAMLASQVQQLEMQLGVEERELSGNSGRVELIRAQLEEAKRQLKKYDEGGVGDYVVALNSVPELARNLAGLLREVKMLETVSAYLRQQLETERINEQRNLPTLNVLDPAVVPDRKSSPRRLTMLLIGLFSGLVLSVLFVCLKKYKENVRSNPDEHTKYITFVGHLKKK